MWRGLLALVFLTFAAEAAAQSSFTEGRGIVLPLEEARKVDHHGARTPPGPIQDVWTPAQADIAALEAALPAIVGAELDSLPNGDQIGTGEYYRQYAGLVIGGRRVIYVNGLHRVLFRSSNLLMAPTPPWRTQYIIFRGFERSVSFGVEYDPATRTFANFQFNRPE